MPTAIELARTAAARQFVDSIFVAVRQIDRQLDALSRDAGYSADILRLLKDADHDIWTLAERVEMFAK